MIRATLTLLATALLVGWGSPARAHPYHTTIAEADWNAESGRLEVALRLLPADLERALEAHVGQASPAAAPTTDDQATLDDHILGWLGQGFRLIPDGGEPAPILWVGKEVSIEHVWLYFEIPLADGLEGVTIEHRLLLDLEPRQVNTLLLGRGKGRRTLTFRRERPRHRLTYDVGD